MTRANNETSPSVANLELVGARPEDAVGARAVGIGRAPEALSIGALHRAGARPVIDAGALPAGLADFVRSAVARFPAGRPVLVTESVRAVVPRLAILVVRGTALRTAAPRQ